MQDHFMEEVVVKHKNGFKQLRSCFLRSAAAWQQAGSTGKA